MFLLHIPKQSSNKCD